MKTAENLLTAAQELAARVTSADGSLTHTDFEQLRTQLANIDRRMADCEARGEALPPGWDWTRERIGELLQTFTTPMNEQNENIMNHDLTPEELSALSDGQLESHFLKRYCAANERSEWETDPDKMKHLASVVAGEGATLGSLIDQREPLASRNLHMIAESIDRLRTKILAKANGDTPPPPSKDGIDPSEPPWRGQ